MKALWKITIDDYLAVIRICKDKGMKAGESMETEFIAYMKEKGQKPIGHTELNKEEMVNEMLSHGNGNILNIETQSNGKQKYEIFKKKDVGLDK